ncbi:MAG: hypothetical protein H6868_01735 [Rhodospirillales bacterium]|nr:hypothetical protein [Rhodospirillales bacterium]
MGKTDSSHLFYDEFSDSFIEKITPYPHDKLHIEILNTADLEPPLPWEKGLTNEDSKKRQIESARRDGKINALLQKIETEKNRNKILLVKDRDQNLIGAFVPQIFMLHAAQRLLGDFGDLGETQHGHFIHNRLSDLQPDNAKSLGLTQNGFRKTALVFLSAHVMKTLEERGILQQESQSDEYALTPVTEEEQGAYAKVIDAKKGAEKAKKTVLQTSGPSARKKKKKSTLTAQTGFDTAAAGAATRTKRKADNPYPEMDFVGKPLELSNVDRRGFNNQDMKDLEEGKTMTAVYQGHVVGAFMRYDKLRRETQEDSKANIPEFRNMLLLSKIDWNEKKTIIIEIDKDCSPIAFMTAPAYEEWKAKNKPKARSLNPG